MEKIEAALAIKQGKAPKSMLSDRDISRYYYNYTIAGLEQALKPPKKTTTWKTPVKRKRK